VNARDDALIASDGDALGACEGDALGSQRTPGVSPLQQWRRSAADEGRAATCPEGRVRHVVFNKGLTFLEPFWRFCLSPAAEAIRGGLPSAVLVVEFCSSHTCEGCHWNVMRIRPSAPPRPADPPWRGKIRVEIGVTSAQAHLCSPDCVGLHVSGQQTCQGVEGPAHSPRG